MLLAIDTSAGISVAVGDAGAVTERVEPRTNAHAEQVGVLVRAACRESGVGLGELTGVVVGTGPAPFTGLRVGLMTALALGDALGIGVVGVCALDVLALQVVAAFTVPAEFVVASDARRREVYWARYRVDAGRCVRVDGPGVARPAELAENVAALASQAPTPVFGPGAALYPDIPGAHGGPLAVSAAALLRGVLDGALETSGTEPLYLRRPDVWLPAGAPA